MEFNLALKKRTNEYFSKLYGFIEKASYRGLYSKFFSKKCVKCSSFENDGELMLMIVQAHSEQQQQCFRLILLDEHEWVYLIRIQFAEFASQIDPQTALKAFLFYQIFHVNFLQFRLKTHHFGSKFSIFYSSV